MNIEIVEKKNAVHEIAFSGFKNACKPIKACVTGYKINSV
jgi:hypothetical protein